jgi:hypothetical protein
MPFKPIITILDTIHDPRRAEGKRFKLSHILLFTIMAIVSGANSYRTATTFMDVHRKKLNKAFKISWKHPPSYSSIRYILHRLKADDVEKAFREHAAKLNQSPSTTSVRAIGMDGKVLRGSFDNFNDQKAKQVLSAFASDTALILAHIEIDEKSNEIPAVQKLLEELDLAGHIVTCDAMHYRGRDASCLAPPAQIQDAPN